VVKIETNKNYFKLEEMAEDLSENSHIARDYFYDLDEINIRNYDKTFSRKLPLFLVVCTFYTILWCNSSLWRGGDWLEVGITYNYNFA
jgi:hypothetical protein